MQTNSMLERSISTELKYVNFVNQSEIDFVYVNNNTSSPIGDAVPIYHKLGLEENENLKCLPGEL